MRKCLPKETPNRLRRLLSILVVVSCMPAAIIIACVHVVWTFAKTHLFLFQLRQYDIITYNQKSDESETLYEAVLIADGWLDRKQFIARFNEKSSPLLACSKYSKGGINIWFQGRKSYSVEEHILEKSCIWKHRRASLSTAYDCASFFLREPLLPDLPPWRITLQYLQDSSYQTLLTVKCDSTLKEIICDIITDNYRRCESPSAFCNTKYVVKNITEALTDFICAVKNYLRRYVKLLCDLKFFTVFVNLFETTVSLCVIFWGLIALGVNWAFGRKPDFVECDCWKEFLLCIEELKTAIRIILQLPREFYIYLKLRGRKTQVTRTCGRQLRRSASEYHEQGVNFPVLTRSNSLTFENVHTDFMWTQPLYEDVLWRLCDVSGIKRSSLLTSVCINELKRATFDLGPTFVNGKISFRFSEDPFVLESGLRPLLDPEVVEREFSRMVEKRREERIKRELSATFRKLFPKCFWSWKKAPSADMAFRFNTPFENSQVMETNLILYADVSRGSHKVIFSVHRGGAHTVITCCGLPDTQLRLLVMGIERRIYAMASQFGVQTKKLSPFSSPQNSAPSTPLHKCYLSSSASSIQELDGE